MNNTFNIEDIKNEITRWATVKTPALYQHFSTYLGISTKAAREFFTGSQEIQDHINQYFEEEKIQENIEREENLKKDLATLEALFRTAVDKKKIFVVEALAKSTGIPRSNIKTFSKKSPELWEMVVGPTAIAERKRIKAERKAINEENRILREERKADREAEKLALAHIKKLSEVKPNRGELTLAQLKVNKHEKPPATPWQSQQFLSCAVCDYAYERGRLVKKICFKLALSELQKIGYIHHLNMFFDGDNKIGLYTQEQDHLGTFAESTGPVFHTFTFTWNNRVCREPKPNKMVALHFKLVETDNKNGLCFALPEEFFLDYLYD